MKLSIVCSFVPNILIQTTQVILEICFFKKFPYPASVKHTSILNHGIFIMLDLSSSTQQFFISMLKQHNGSLMHLCQTVFTCGRAAASARAASPCRSDTASMMFTLSCFFSSVLCKPLIKDIYSSKHVCQDTILQHRMFDFMFRSRKIK